MYLVDTRTAAALSRVGEGSYIQTDPCRGVPKLFIAIHEIEARGRHKRLRIREDHRRTIRSPLGVLRAERRRDKRVLIGKVQLALRVLPGESKNCMIDAVPGNKTQSADQVRDTRKKAIAANARTDRNNSA